VVAQVLDRRDGRGPEFRVVGIRAQEFAAASVADDREHAHQGLRVIVPYVP
jgi:hypothetical protein